MRLGDLEFMIVSDGGFRLDGGAMFGVVPKPLWEKKIPGDDRNRIQLGMNCVLVRTAGKTVLIETGAGDKLDAKLRGIYAIEEGPRLLDRLVAHGVTPDRVDIVVDTHLHFDHCGWNTRIVNGKAVPTFPNAQYFLQRDELEHAKAPNERDRASYMPDNFLPVEAAGQFVLLDGDREIVAGHRGDSRSWTQCRYAMRTAFGRRKIGVLFRGFGSDHRACSFSVDYGLRLVSHADARE